MRRIMANLSFDDAKTFECFQAGDTTGVFQLESSGMKNLMVRLHPESFDDLTALVALYRPGPLDSGMVDDFVDRKHGRKEGGLPGGFAGADSQGNLRRNGLPGAGHAGGRRPLRLHHGRCRQPAQGHRQEDRRR
jgi:hypothetical protein